MFLEREVHCLMLRHATGCQSLKLSINFKSINGIKGLAPDLIKTRLVEEIARVFNSFTTFLTPLMQRAF
jgi:hypothetical protein